MTHYMNEKACMVLPALNEYENLRVLVPMLRDYHIFIVDDGSNDGTQEFCNAFSNVTLIERGSKKGLVSAELDGMAAALEDYEYMVISDADLSHDPRFIPGMLEEAVRRNADLVIGSRYVKGGKSLDTPLRQLISKGANALFKLSFSRRIRDATSGFRVYSRRAARFIIDSNSKDPVSNSYAGQIDILQRLIKNKFNVVEHPITFTPRENGNSKLSGHDIREYAMLAGRKGHLRRYVGIVVIGLLFNQSVMAFSVHSIAAFATYTGAQSGIILGLTHDGHRFANSKVKNHLSNLRDFYIRYAGLAMISILVNSIVFAFLWRSGINFPLADVAGIISALCLTYLMIP